MKQRNPLYSLAAVAAIISAALLTACGNEAPPQAAQDTQPRESITPQSRPQPAAEAPQSNITDDMLLGTWRMKNPPEHMRNFIIGFDRTDQGLVVFTGDFTHGLARSDMYVEIIGDKIGGFRPDPLIYRSYRLRAEYNASNQSLTVFDMRNSGLADGTVFYRDPR